MFGSFSMFYVGAFCSNYEVAGSLDSRGYLRFVTEPSFPSASGFFYLCKKCEAAHLSCSVSCLFHDSLFYKV